MFGQPFRWMLFCQMNHPFLVDPELSERLYKMFHKEATVERGNQASNLGHFSGHLTVRKDGLEVYNVTRQLKIISYLLPWC